MNIIQLGHLAYTCKDLSVSIHFYRDQLGLKHKFTITYGDMLDHALAESKRSGTEVSEEMVQRLTPIRDREWIAYFEVGEGAFFELFDAGHATEYAVPDDNHFNFSHVAIVVNDIYEAEKALTAAGVPIDTPPRLGLEHTYQMWSHDPDENKIEFMQYTPESWQLVGR